MSVEESSLSDRLANLYAVSDDLYSPYRLATYLVVGISIIIFGFPLYYVFISSIKPLAAITDFPPALVPSQVSLESYARLINDTAFPIWLRNSLIVAVGDVILAVTVSSLAGYALTRYNLPMKKWLARMLIFGYMFPPLTLAVPYYLIFLRINLLDTLPALILAHTAGIVPFTTWLMWQFFQTVPISLEEAAWANGASRYRAMFEIVFPSALPGMVATAIFAFAIGWSDFTFALILTSTTQSEVLTVGIQSFIGNMQIYWGNLMAASTVLILPPFLVVLFLNRYILKGFTLRN